MYSSLNMADLRGKEEIQRRLKNYSYFYDSLEFLSGNSSLVKQVYANNVTKTILTKVWKGLGESHTLPVNPNTEELEAELKMLVDYEYAGNTGLDCGWVNTIYREQDCPWLHDVAKAVLCDEVEDHLTLTAGGTTVVFSCVDTEKYQKMNFIKNLEEEAEKAEYKMEVSFDNFPPFSIRSQSTQISSVVSEIMSQEMEKYWGKSANTNVTLD